MNGRVLDDTARRLFVPTASAASPRAPLLRTLPAGHGADGQRPLPTSSAGLAPAAVLPQAPSGLVEDEAEAALRYLEAEWAMRMEAPLSALACLEDTLVHALDNATRALPQSASGLGGQSSEGERSAR